MSGDRTAQIRLHLKRLAAVHAATISAHEEAIAIFQAELDALDDPATHDAGAQPPASSDRPAIDKSKLSVVYRGGRCFLGNTLGLRFLERLLRRPNQYLSYATLLDDVWQAQRADSSVRSVVKELRSKLRMAGMVDLAEAIDGRVKGHYGLMLAGRW
ncbi:MAG TPA: winged helix-turn-helix domain-containing protein [Planctomycetaceae bacterium]|nr:winged helix-turn-helix domain-containing protein [Planctomycetaceae bacterium]